MVARRRPFAAAAIEAVVASLRLTCAYLCIGISPSTSTALLRARQRGLANAALNGPLCSRIGTAGRDANLPASLGTRDDVDDVVRQ